MITVKIRQLPGKSKALRVAKGTTIDEVLRKLGTHRDRVIVRKEGRPIPESERLQASTTLEVIDIISGG